MQVGTITTLVCMYPCVHSHVQYVAFKRQNKHTKFTPRSVSEIQHKETTESQVSHTQQFS